MRLARIRFLRFPFCVGRPSEPPNCLDGRKRDPDPDGGGGCGNPYARASAPTNSVTSMRTSSSSSSSTRSSAPSVSSRSAECSNDPKGFQATLHDTTSKEKLANSDDNTNAKETDDTTEKLGQCQIGSEGDYLAARLRLPVVKRNGRGHRGAKRRPSLRLPPL